MVDGDGMEQLLAAIAADADDLCAVLGIVPPERPCPYCGREVPPDGRTYGNPRHRSAAGTARYRAAHPERGGR
jgi:hypothetical protein